MKTFVIEITDDDDFVRIIPARREALYEGGDKGFAYYRGTAADSVQHGRCYDPYFHERLSVWLKSQTQEHLEAK